MSKMLKDGYLDFSHLTEKYIYHRNLYEKKKKKTNHRYLGITKLHKTIFLMVFP